MIAALILMQAQPQTVCSEQLGRTVCEQRGPMDYQAMMDQAASQIQPQDDSLEKSVSRKVLRGDCDGARKQALRAGDVNLAARVGEICK